MTEKDLQIQDLKAENEKLKEELEQLKQPKAAVDTDMDKLTTEMMEHICDNLCKHPCNAKDQEELDDICAECKMGKFVCDILNTYNRHMQQATTPAFERVVERLEEKSYGIKLEGALVASDKTIVELEDAIKILKDEKYLFIASEREAQENEAVDMAIKALEEIEQYRELGNVEELKEAKEKQTPKIPNIEGDGYADGHLVYDTWICPNCEEHYEIDYDDYDYCPKCGQAIDKSEMGVNT